MNSVGRPSPFEVMMSDEINLHILSFLDKKNVQAVACTNTRCRDFARDFQIWKQRAEFEFGKFIAEGAKQTNKSWKQTYEELSISKKDRIENLAEATQAQVKKAITDDVQYRTSLAASQVLGFTTPSSSTHHYPTGQMGYLGNRKISVFKNTK